MEDYKNILNLKKNETTKNIIKICTEWDCNDGDLVEKTRKMDSKLLFGDKKLIYCLAYVSLNYNFKGHNWNDIAFCHHIPENKDIDDLYYILDNYDLIAHTDWGPCHSLYGLEITYYDENGISYDVTFDDIISQFKKMTYEEICDFINNIES